MSKLNKLVIFSVTCILFLMFFVTSYANNNLIVKEIVVKVLTQAEIDSITREGFMQEKITLLDPKLLSKIMCRLSTNQNLEITPKQLEKEISITPFEATKQNLSVLIDVFLNNGYKYPVFTTIFQFTKTTSNILTLGIGWIKIDSRNIIYVADVSS